MKKKLLCVVLCLVCCLGFAGCGNGTNDIDEYENFVHMQARYETEKELISLLREYNEIYTTYGLSEIDNYTEYFEAITIAFKIDGKTVLTDSHLKSVSVGVFAGYDCVQISLDNEGTEIFADVTSQNIGKNLDIVEIRNNNQTVLYSASIADTIANGHILIETQDSTSAKALSIRLELKTADNSLNRVAKAYNAKRADNISRLISTSYLPEQLPEIPNCLDVSDYLSKASEMGF